MYTFHWLRLWIAVVLYAVFVGILFIVKPALMFDSNGDFKAWACSTSNNCSIFAPSLLIPLAGVIAYFIAAILEVMLDP